jgi:hypothetical protein
MPTFYSQSGQWLADKIDCTTIAGTHDDKIPDSKSSLGGVEDSRALLQTNEVKQNRCCWRVYKLVGCFSKPPK